MSQSVVITPGGQLRLTPDPAALPVLSSGVSEALASAFGQSSASGLLLLASEKIGQELPPALVFWREISRCFFQAVCQLGEASLAQWKSIPPPPEEQLAEWISEAPPMRGLEYLNPALLRARWTELSAEAAGEARRFPEGPAAYLRSVNPLWHLLGRVTFHLAENKRDPDHPFAFLATYTHRLSGQARLQHLPLAGALRTYAAAKDRDKLEALLAPVRRAAQESPLIRELLDTKALFAPQAWTIRFAYRFLTEAPQMEQAGVVVRVPDWWSARRPPRPQVQVRIGNRPIAQIGLAGLLDFDVGLTLDGERLSDEERRRLLAATDGLVLLRGKWVEANAERLQQALAHWDRVQQIHADGISFVESMRLLAGASTTEVDTPEAATADWSQVTAGEWLRQTLERLRQPDQIDACQPGASFAPGCGRTR